MSSNRPVDPGESLVLFGKRGGGAADNTDGWGLAYLESEAWQLYKAPEAAAWSEGFANLAGAIHTNLMIAHVRKANPPTEHTFHNTHPFTRNCCDRQWVFAHNGKVPELLQPEGCFYPRLSRPLGKTDSEHAFCYLLDEIARTFNDVVAIEDKTWFQTLATLSGSIASYGQFNFLMSDGNYLIAYGHDRLHHLNRRSGDCKITLFASEPLGGEGSWEAFLPRELRVYRAGQEMIRLRTQSSGALIRPANPVKLSK